MWVKPIKTKQTMKFYIVFYSISNYELLIELVSHHNDFRALKIIIP